MVEVPHSKYIYKNKRRFFNLHLENHLKDRQKDSQSVHTSMETAKNKAAAGIFPGGCDN